MNGKDWLIKGDKECDDALALEYYTKAVESDDLWYIDKLRALVQMSYISMSSNDTNSAFKYAALASVCTKIPRADVCCLLGMLYSAIGVDDWSEKWFKSAINNIPEGSEGEGLNPKYYLWFPLIGLGNLAFRNEKFDEAMEYNKAVLLIAPDNEEAKENVAYLEKRMKES